jgi:hypothetical protein
VPAQPKKSPGKTPKPSGSSQGEHIFNALGDLVKELAEYMWEVLALNLAEDEIASPEWNQAAGTLNGLIAMAETAVRLRDNLDSPNNTDFRSAEEGDVRNQDRYSDFAQRTRQAIRQIVDGGPSEQTQGYTTLTRFQNNIDDYIIDARARTARHDALPANRQGQFDQWEDRTKDLMHDLYKLLKEAAGRVAVAVGNVRKIQPWRPRPLTPPKPPLGGGGPKKPLFYPGSGMAGSRPRTDLK